MVSGKPELSIIIISYNTAKITVNCLESVIKALEQSNKVAYEIIVIDNASTDNSIEQIKNLELRIKNSNLKLKIIRNTDNLGFARANNQGVRQAHGKYILFLNSDIIVLDQAIPKLLSFYRQNEDKIHFLGGKLLEKDGITPQPSCGPFYRLPVVLAALFLRGDYWGLTRQSPNKTTETDWISGACILTKKRYFEKISGFDEKIFMYMDEIDLLYRAKKQRFKVFFYPTAKFIHLASASSGGRTYPIIQVYKGLLYFYKIHHSGLELYLLKILLKLKALIALLVGKFTNNGYLIKTYEKAYRITEES